MSRSTYPLLLILVPSLLLAGCEGGPPWGGDRDEDVTTDRDVFGPTAAYDRRLIFLGPGGDLPTAAVFDFAALSDSAGLRRGVRARLVDGEEWIPLLDAGWEMDPMREPWRLVPHGPVKVVVGEAGELDAVIYRGSEDTEGIDMRLELGPAIAEYSPDAGTQLVLRQGRLRLGDEPILGILLDAQLARAIIPAAALARPDTLGPLPDSLLPDSLLPDTLFPDTTTPAQADNVPGAGTATGDTVADSARGGTLAPTPLVGAGALLLDNSGFYVVFAASADGEIAWIHSGGRDDVRPSARLEATAWETLPEAGIRVPTAWRISSPGGVVAGELRGQAADRSVIEGEAGPGSMTYVIVTGWVEDRGVRRNVYGLVRHVR